MVYLKTIDTEMKYGKVQATNAGMNEAMQDMKKAEAADKQAGLAEAKKPATSASTFGSPLKSVNVYLNNKLVRAVYNGEGALIRTQGKSVAIEVFTAGKEVEKVTMLINNKVRWRDSRTPYVFGGNNGQAWRKWKKPIFNKKFKFSAFVNQGGQKKYINVWLTLKK